MELANIRKPWAPLLGLDLVLLIANIWPYFRMMDGIHPVAALQTGIDVAIIYGLFGYVVRRPIRSLALRVFYLLLVLVIALRVVVAGYVLVPNLFPWEGTHEQYVSAWTMLGVSLALLTAFALWSYATKPQGVQPAARHVA